MDREVETQTEVTTVAHEQPAKVVKTVKQVTPPPIKTEHPQKVFQKKKAIFRTYQIVWYILAVIELLLGFRITLLALGANASSGFVNLVYVLSNPLALPFRGILQSNAEAGSVFEWSTIIAAIVYAIIAVGIVQLIQLFKPVTPDEVEQTVDNTV